MMVTVAEYEPVSAHFCGLTQAGYQAPTKATHLVPSAAGEERKFNKGFTARDKDGERLLTKYYQGQNRCNLKILSEFTPNKVRPG